MSNDQLLPLPLGAVSVLEQAQARGEPNPVGLTVAQLRALGYDLKGLDDAPPDAVYRADERSPTGFAVSWKGPRLRTHEPFNEQSARFFLAN